MNFIAIIPARGGSKGVPNKNIKILGDLPLIAWTIKAALASRCFERVIVSTDSKEIAEISKKYGADVPVLRPEEIAQDSSPAIDYLLHMLNHLESAEGRRFDFVALLQPTSPFRTAKDICDAVGIIKMEGFDSLVSFVKSMANPYRIVFKEPDGTFKRALPKNPLYFQRQNLPVCFEFNGAIYINKWEKIIHKKEVFSQPCYLFEMARHNSLDIDTQEDWDLAEDMLNGRTG